MDGLRILFTVIVAFLTYRSAKKGAGANPVWLAVLFTLLIGLFGLSNRVLEEITNNAAKVNADEFYGITATGLGLALPAGIITYLIRSKIKPLFILMLVITLVLLRVDAFLVDITLGPISDWVNDAWNWLYPEIKKQIESI